MGFCLYHGSRVNEEGSQKASGNQQHKSLMTHTVTILFWVLGGMKGRETLNLVFGGHVASSVGHD